MRFAITREISSGMEHCELTYLDRVEINLTLARQQHDGYIRLLEELGCKVICLPEAPDLPDSVFVEDTAVVFPEIAVITRPGAVSRQPEIQRIADTLKSYRPLAWIQPPATLDGGDVLRIGKHVFVGSSPRSNQAGFSQLRNILSPYGYQLVEVPVYGCLHLKSAVSQVAEDTVLINSTWIDETYFASYSRINIDPLEPYAANGLLIGEKLIYPARFEHTQSILVKHGINIKTVDLSELEKAEGAVTCCSLIIENL